MAANKQQGQWFGLFLAGATAACAGMAGIGSGSGKVALALGAIVIVVSMIRFFGIKKLEGVTAEGAQPAAMKLVGLIVTVAGWMVVLLGLHVTKATSGRLVVALVGLAIALVGPVIILPSACNKNAIWKA